MVYAKHLGELFEIMGDMGFENIGVIFDHFVIKILLMISWKIQMRSKDN